MTLVLQPHPAAGTPAPVRVEATATRAGDVLTLAFAVAGDLSRLRVAPPSRSERADDLWRTTCFEAFVRPEFPDGPDGPDGVLSPETPSGSPSHAGYVELNLSPSGRWAAYAFDAYRSGMRHLELVAPPRIAFSRRDHGVALTAVFDLAGALPSGAPWRLGLSAVIEDADGRIAHLALGHAPDRPDFHHPDSFVLQLTADA